MSSSKIYLSLVALALAGIANADNLGVANAYNDFIIGNATQSGVDALGAYAVGGNANLTNFTVASALPTDSALNLVVGGTLTYTGGSVHGSSYSGGDTTYSDPTVSGNIYSNGSVTLGNNGTVGGGITYANNYTNPNTTVSGAATKGSTTAPINFATAATQLLSLSSSWSGIAATGTTSDPYGGINLTGTNTTGTEVFNISASQLNSANGITLTNVNSNATVLINISGTSDSMQNFGINLGGVSANHVVYNFYQATSLYISGIGIEGSVLAAGAAVNFAGGDIDGTMVAGSLTGNGESHNYTFTGNVQPAPEPFTCVLVAGSLVTMIRRRAAKKN